MAVPRHLAYFADFHPFFAATGRGHRADGVQHAAQHAAGRRHPGGAAPHNHIADRPKYCQCCLRCKACAAGGCCHPLYRMSLHSLSRTVQQQVDFLTREQLGLPNAQVLRQAQARLPSQREVEFFMKNGYPMGQEPPQKKAQQPAANDPKLKSFDRSLAKEATRIFVDMTKLNRPRSRRGRRRSSQPTANEVTKRSDPHVQRHKPFKGQRKRRSSRRPRTPSSGPLID